MRTAPYILRSFFKENPVVLMVSMRRYIITFYFLFTGHQIDGHFPVKSKHNNLYKLINKTNKSF